MNASPQVISLHVDGNWRLQNRQMTKHQFRGNHMFMLCVKPSFNRKEFSGEILSWEQQALAMHIPCSQAARLHVVGMQSEKRYAMTGE